MQHKAYQGFFPEVQRYFLPFTKGKNKTNKQRWIAMEKIY